MKPPLYARFGAIILAAALSAAAQAAPRAFVSGVGTDSPTCGPVATPCRTPQYAHDTIVSAGGEIDVLDGAGYGAITITKAISIINDGVGIAGFLAPANGNAITITAANSDAVVLRGLTIEGSNVGINGIVLNSGGRLTVSNSSIQGFVSNGMDQGNGILLRPTAGSGANGIDISNSKISNCAGAGILFKQPNPLATVNANLAIYRVTMNRNGIGAAIWNVGPGTLKASFFEATASGNGQGFLFESDAAGTVVGSLESSAANNNTTYGVHLVGKNAKLYTGDTAVVGNNVSVRLDAAFGGIGTLLSYGDNKIGGGFSGGTATTVGLK